MTDEEKNLLKAAASELCKTADLAKGFNENIKWLTQQYKTLVAELEDEVRALKSDAEQLEKAMHDYEGLLDAEKHRCKEMRSYLDGVNETSRRLASEVETLKAAKWACVLIAVACVTKMILEAYL